MKKTKYIKPLMRVVVMQGKSHLLTGSNKSGIQATINGYDADTDSDGFSQD